MRFKFPGIKQVSHRDVTYRIRNIVNGIVIAWDGVRRFLDLSWTHL